MHAEVGWYEDFNMKTIAYEANKRAEEKWRDHMREVRRQQARYGGEFAYYDLVDIDRDRKPKETQEEIKAKNARKALKRLKRDRLERRKWKTWRAVFEEVKKAAERQKKEREAWERELTLNGDDCGRGETQPY